MTLRYEKTAFYPVAEGEHPRKDKLGRKGGQASEFVGKVIFTVYRLAEKLTGFPGRTGLQLLGNRKQTPTPAWGWDGGWECQVSMARPELQVPRDTTCPRTRS